MTTKRKTEAGPQPNLPVTPMLDMAFQLLAFFVMTYHPSDLEGQMELSLPSEEVTKAQDASEVKDNAESDKDKPLDLPAKLSVMERTQRDGANNGLISGVGLQDEAGQQQVDVSTGLDKLLAELKKRREGLENNDNIKIQADRKLKWDKVVQVMDVCKQAGFKNISFVKPPEGS
jgi:biopolymer transport protein ExbD